MESALNTALRAESPALLKRLFSAIGQLAVPAPVLRRHLLSAGMVTPVSVLMAQGKNEHLTLWLSALETLPQLTAEDRLQLMTQSSDGLSPLYAALIHQQHKASEIYLASLQRQNFTASALLHCLSNAQAGLHNLFYIPIALNDLAGVMLLFDGLSQSALSKQDLFHYLADEYQVSLKDGPDLVGKTAFQLAVIYGDDRLIEAFANRVDQLALSRAQIRQILWGQSQDGNNALIYAQQADREHKHATSRSLTRLAEQLMDRLK